MLSFMAISFRVLLISTVIVLTAITALVVKWRNKNEKKYQDMATLFQDDYLIESMPGKIAQAFGYNLKWTKTLTNAAMTILALITHFLSSTVLGLSYVTILSGLTNVSHYGIIYLHIGGMFILTNIAHRFLSASDQQEKLFSVNPASRLWQAMNKFFLSFFLYGQKNRITMLTFTTLYASIVIDLNHPFLPNLIHQLLVFFAAGIINLNVGMVIAGLCTAWTIGLLYLGLADTITRDYDSNLVHTIDYIKQNPIDPFIGLFILALSTQLIASTSLAHLCGNWVMFGLLISIVKPLLTVVDFLVNPLKSIIGSALRIIFLPVNIVMYPDEAMRFVLKFVLHTACSLFKHFCIHIPLVLIRAVLDILSITAKPVSAKTANYFDDTNETLNYYINCCMLWIRTHGKYANIYLKPIYPKIATITHMIGCLYFSMQAVIGLSAIGLNIEIAATLPHWLNAPFFMLANAYTPLQGAIILATFSVFITSMCLHQVHARLEPNSKAASTLLTTCQFILFATVLSTFGLFYLTGAVQAIACYTTCIMTPLTIGITRIIIAPTSENRNATPSTQTPHPKTNDTLKPDQPSVDEETVDTKTAYAT